MLSRAEGSRPKALLRQVEEAAKHRYFCPYKSATVYVSLGDADTAYELFRKGTDERADCMAWLGVEPWIDRIPLGSALPKPAARHRVGSRRTITSRRVVKWAQLRSISICDRFSNVGCGSGAQPRTSFY